MTDPKLELSDRLVWVDLEMTGLDPNRDVIVEIATLITDGDLRIIAEGPSLVIHQPDEVLATMDPIVASMHARSGLTERIRASKITLAEAEEQTAAFIAAHTSREDRPPLCGNSIWKDRTFLDAYMPKVVALLHYRLIDVSTIKELVRRWYPEGFAAPKKKESHRALDDIRESLEELAHYRRQVFLPAPAS
jgi:oligoribonuclease